MGLKLYCGADEATSCILDEEQALLKGSEPHHHLSLT
jgi:hypothetical protein